MPAGLWGAKGVGVDCTLFKQLAELSTRFKVKGRALMLGRQTFKIEPQFKMQYEAALKAAGIDRSRFSYLQDDGFSEKLFGDLGLGEIETLDISDFEGATILQDLNRPVPKKLHGKFDFIFDGGTIEHVFNTPMALTNMFNMLRVGGRFVSANGMNGWVGHGMYQFNPELVWTFWRRSCNCTVHSCIGLPKIPGGADPLIFPDPAEKGKRLRLKGKVPAGRVYLYYEVEKTRDSSLSSLTFQSDYVAKWEIHDKSEVVA